MRSLSQQGLTRQSRVCCQSIELDAKRVVRSAQVSILHQRSHFLGDGLAWRFMGWRSAGGFLSTTHQRPELAFDTVVHKKFFSQRRLVIEHVNQKTQSAQVVAQLVKSTGSARALLVNFSLQHLLNAVTHAHDGLRGLVQAKH